MKYKPLERNGRFGWQCAYVDAFAYHYVLPGPIWKYLSCWGCEEDGLGLFKWYKSEEIAMKKLEEVVQCVERFVKKYRG